LLPQLRQSVFDEHVKQGRLQAVHNLVVVVTLLKIIDVVLEKYPNGQLVIHCP
jgi:hypothetical protein